MLSSSLAPLVSPAVRSSEWLAGIDRLSSTAMSTEQLAHLGPLPSIESLSNDLTTAGGVTSPQPAVDLANALVRDVHAQLEELGHQNPSLNEPIHDVTNLGETIGLGHLGEPGHLLTDALGAASSPLSPNGAASLFDDAGKAVAALGEFGDLPADATSSSGGVIGSGGLVAPVTGFANSVVLDFHHLLEYGVGHQVPVLNGPIHGLTNLGETIGLGYLGTPGNFLTDTIGAPGTLLSGGGLSTVIPLLHDLGNTVSAAGGLVNGVLHAGEGLVTPTGPLAPVTNLANAAVIDVHAALEEIGHEIPVLNGPIHALTGLGETVGLGHLGQSGTLLTDVANLPGQVLNGQGVQALEGVVADLGNVAGATGALVESVAGAAPGGLAGDLVGAGQPLQPVADIANGVVDGVHSVLEQAGHDVPILNQPIHDVINVGTAAGLGAIGEGHNLVTDVVNLPGEALTVTLAGQPPLSTSNLLGGDSLHLPVVLPMGGDALVGKLTELPSVASGIPAVGEPSHDLHAQSPLPLDFGGDAHVLHTDAGASHSASSSVHLLGL